MSDDPKIALVHDAYPMYRSKPDSFDAEREWYIAVSSADREALDAGRSRMDLAMAHLRQAITLSGRDDPWVYLAEITPPL